MVCACTDHVSNLVRFRQFSMRVSPIQSQPQHLPSLSPPSTMSMHPHHSCTAVRPSFPGHSAHVVPLTHVVHASSPCLPTILTIADPSVPSQLTQPRCHIHPLHIPCCLPHCITHIPPRLIHICPCQCPQYHQRVRWCAWVCGVFSTL